MKKKKCKCCSIKRKLVAAVKKTTAFDESKLVGMMLSEAKAQFPDQRIREVIANGKGMAVTCDFCPTRINVATENGFIIAIDSHG